MKHAGKLARAILSIGLPLVYALIVYLATRPPKPLYALPGKTVLTVTGQVGPVLPHDGR